MITPRYVLALDGGGSKTEAELRRADGTLLARGRGGPANLFRDRDGALAAVESLWQRCCDGAALDPETARGETALSAGLAGVSAAGAVEAFGHAFRGFGAAHLSSDAFVALLGGFGGAPGVLLSVGTGTVACLRDRDGGFRRLGGWGFPVGDRGGGAWLGLQLLTAWLEHRDGVHTAESSALLWRAVEERLGTDRTAILAWLREAAPAHFATLAPLVAEAALRGDAFAAALLDEAATHLARLALALEPSAGVPVLVGGGLAPALRPRLARILGSTLLAQGRQPTPLHGAWLVGTGRFPPELAAPPSPHPGSKGAA
ncbi:BadF/BadG/BcrA/BcrD ATPase family protein [Roseomonas elaeocarpi]|uniref:BadF/BadG/BcrA/BcrD ATPase family protein n=1 Tax=Roseomonas elaeocarpi TaxID=907779 RepID=A0ABV6JQM9_9PROT